MKGEHFAYKLFILINVSGLVLSDFFACIEMIKRMDKRGLSKRCGGGDITGGLGGSVGSFGGSVSGFGGGFGGSAGGFSGGLGTALGAGLGAVGLGLAGALSHSQTVYSGGSVVTHTQKPEVCPSQDLIPGSCRTKCTILIEKEDRIGSLLCTGKKCCVPRTVKTTTTTTVRP